MNQQNKTERWEETIKDTRKKQLELEIHALANCNRPDIIEDGIHTLLSDARREERERCLEALPKKRNTNDDWKCNICGYEGGKCECVGYNKALTTAEESIKNLK